MQQYIIATDHIPKFSTCPLCRSDIIGDALTFVKYGHPAKSTLDLVNHILAILLNISNDANNVEINHSNSASSEKDFFKLDHSYDTLNSKRTRWIKDRAMAIALEETYRNRIGQHSQLSNYINYQMYVEQRLLKILQCFALSRFLQHVVSFDMGVVIVILWWFATDLLTEKEIDIVSLVMINILGIDAVSPRTSV